MFASQSCLLRHDVAVRSPSLEPPPQLRVHGGGRVPLVQAEPHLSKRRARRPPRMRLGDGVEDRRLVVAEHAAPNQREQQQPVPAEGGREVGALVRRGQRRRHQPPRALPLGVAPRRVERVVEVDRRAEHLVHQRPLPLRQQRQRASRRPAVEDDLGLDVPAHADAVRQRRHGRGGVLSRGAAAAAQRRLAVDTAAVLLSQIAQQLHLPLRRLTPRGGGRRAVVEREVSAQQARGRHAEGSGGPLRGVGRVTGHEPAVVGRNAT
mmetsp:Transcript_3016/g.9384  ORF Transcript_3016/g.9384 Transcript_3016/m.9384 type:complete len:264 (+) Transcript_3016:154-945(+)